MEARTTQQLKSLLIENNINPDDLFNVVKQGIEVERLSYSAKLTLDDYSYLKAQKTILNSENFLALLCRL